METLTTKGIKISVETFYHEKHSRPVEQKFVFVYQINIENKSNNTVQLLRRHWYIFDSNGLVREVEGDGVIGKQPILRPGQSHKYVSWSPLQSEMGKMYGYFLMLDRVSKSQFKVPVPEFKLIAPFKMN